MSSLLLLSCRLAVNVLFICNGILLLIFLQAQELLALSYQASELLFQIKWNEISRISYFCFSCFFFTFFSSTIKIVSERNLDQNVHTASCSYPNQIKIMNWVDSTWYIRKKITMWNAMRSMLDVVAPTAST